MNKRRPPRIGLALGSGSARGWAHIGVIRVLERAGIQPDLVCGTSVGALVGAAYAADELERFEKWLRGLNLKTVISFMDVSLSGGMIKGERLVEFFRSRFEDRPVEDLALPFAAVATALHSGAEIWLREGSTVEAVRASIAMPGVFTPVLHEGHLLVDGGLVNPVPVSLARAMGADVVIAVDLSTDILGRHLREGPGPEPETDPAAGLPGSVSQWGRRLQERLGSFLPERAEAAPRLPSMINVMASSINIMQVRINRSRMAGEPPDVVVAPRLAQLGLLDFHRAEEAIAEGERAAEAALPSLAACLKQLG